MGLARLDALVDGQVVGHPPGDGLGAALDVDLAVGLTDCVLTSGFIVDSGGTDRYTLSTLLGLFPAGRKKSIKGSRHATPRRHACF